MGWNESGTGESNLEMTNGQVTNHPCDIHIGRYHSQFYDQRLIVVVFVVEMRCMNRKGEDVYSMSSKNEVIYMWGE